MFVGGLIIWQLDTWYPPILNALARTAIADRQLEEAERYLNAVTLLVPHDAEAWFLRARVHRKKGTLGEVGKCLKRASDAGLSIERVRREEWLAQAQAGQFREATRHLSALLTDPRGDEQEICEAYVLGAIRTRRTGLALKLLELWVADYPQAAYPRLLRGQLWMQSEQFESAAADLNAAIELEPSMVSARMELAEALVELHQAEEARRVLQPVLQNEQYRTRSLILVARSYRIQGEPELALRAVAEALQREPGHAHALQQAGRLKLDAGDAAGAVGVLDSALAREPHNLETRYLLGQALEMLDRRDEAQEQLQIVAETRTAHDEIQRLTDAVKRDPNNAELRFQIGQLTLRHGDPDDAVMWLLSALDIQPGHVDACRLLAEHYRMRAQVDPGFRALADEYAKRTGAPPALPAADDDSP